MAVKVVKAAPAAHQQRGVEISIFLDGYQCFLGQFDRRFEIADQLGSGGTLIKWLGLFLLHAGLENLQVLALGIQSCLLDFQDLAARWDGPVNRERRQVGLRSHQLVATHDHLISIPSNGVAHSGLVAQALQIEDEVFDFAGIGEQSEDLHCGGGLLGRADIRTHQALENGERFVALAEVRINLAEPEARFRAEFRILRCELERLDGALLFLRRALIDAGAADAEVAAAGIFALGKSFQTVSERGLGFDRLGCQQISQTQIEVEQLQRRILVITQRFEQLLDLGNRRGIILRHKSGFRFAEKSVQRRRWHVSRRGGGYRRRCLGFQAGSRNDAQEGTGQKRRPSRGELKGFSVDFWHHTDSRQKGDHGHRSVKRDCYSL